MMYINLWIVEFSEGLPAHSRLLVLATGGRWNIAPKQRQHSTWYVRGIHFLCYMLIFNDVIGKVMIVMNTVYYCLTIYSRPPFGGTVPQILLVGFAFPSGPASVGWLLFITDIVRRCIEGKVWHPVARQLSVSPHAKMEQPMLQIHYGSHGGQDEISRLSNHRCLKIGNHPNKNSSPTYDHFCRFLGPEFWDILKRTCLYRYIHVYFEVA